MLRLRPLPALLGAAALAAACASPPGAPSRDALGHVVSVCLGRRGTDYCERCRFPVAGACATATACTSTTEVWAQTPEYVAIRDLKMCGCPPEFVHGLVLPRAPVRGSEDARRPDGIWRFAWEVARSRIPDESEIALVVNPPAHRSQDHLHVHLVRLQPRARARVVALGPERIKRLEETWAASDRHALARGIDRPGVIVIRDPDGEFLVAADDGPIEQRFTAGLCR